MLRLTPESSLRETHLKVLAEVRLDMLLIRRSQMEAFGEARRLDLYNRIAAHLRAEHPAAVRSLTDQALREYIKLGCRRAARWKFARESSVATFVMLMFVVAPDFDAYPAVRRVLEDDRVPLDQRPLLLAHDIGEKQWDKVRRSSMTSSWRELGGEEPGIDAAA